MVDLGERISFHLRLASAIGQATLGFTILAIGIASVAVTTDRVGIGIWSGAPIALAGAFGLIARRSENPSWLFLATIHSSVFCVTIAIIGIIVATSKLCIGPDHYISEYDFGNTYRWVVVLDRTYYIFQYVMIALLALSLPAGVLTIFAYGNMLEKSTDGMGSNVGTNRPHETSAEEQDTCGINAAFTENWP